MEKKGRTALDIANGVGAALGGVRSPDETTVALLAKLGGTAGEPEKAAQPTAAAPAP